MDDASTSVCVASACPSSLTSAGSGQTRSAEPGCGSSGSPVPSKRELACGETGAWWRLNEISVRKRGSLGSVRAGSAGGANPIGLRAGCAMVPPRPA